MGLYPTFVKQASGREVPVVQAYAFTKYLGRLRIQFDADGEIASRDAVEGLPVLLDHTMPQGRVGAPREGLPKYVGRNV